LSVHRLDRRGGGAVRAVQSEREREPVPAPWPAPAGLGDSDYESSTAGLGAEFLLVSTNSLPVALAPGEWYLAVSNQEVTAVDYSCA